MHFEQLQTARIMSASDNNQSEIEQSNGTKSLLLKTEAPYYMRKKNLLPLDSSRAVMIQKLRNNETLFKISDKYEFNKFAIERELRSMYNVRKGNSLKTRLKKANLYKKYEANTLSSSEFLEMSAEELNKWISQAGVLSLIERGLVPRSVQDDMGPALKGFYEKNYLRAVQSRMFSVQLKTDHGSIWEQPRRVYLPALKLLPDLSREQYCHTGPSESVSLVGSQRSSFIINEESEKELLEQNVSLINPTYATGWVIYIQNGRIIETTESFLSYYQTITEMNFQSVAGYIIDSIVRLSISYSIPLITIKCYEIIELCKQPLLTPIPNEKLLKCIFNAPEAQNYLNQKCRLFLNGDIGKNIAAGVIQYYYHRFKTRVQREQNELNFRARRRIRAFLVRFKAKKSFKRKFVERMEASIKGFEIIQANFLRASFSIKGRVLISICPPEAPNETFNHLYRAYSLLLDPNLTIILVLHNPPYNLKEQVSQVTDSNRQGDPILKKRLHIVVTETSPHLPANSSSGASLLLSPEALSKVKELCKGKHPLLIADMMTKHVVSLCSEIRCPFYGSAFKASHATKRNSLEIYNWFHEFGLPMMPAFEMKRSYQNHEIIQKAKEITDLAPDVNRWKFTPYDRFGRKHLNFDYVEKLGLETPSSDSTHKEKNQSLWIFGGLLEALPHFERYKLIQVGIQLDPNGTWKILATTESNIFNHKEIGLVIPQQTITPDDLTDLILKVVVCLKEHSSIGFFTVLIYHWENPDTNEFKISSIVTYLNRAILQSLGFTTKSRLVLDPTDHSLSLLSNETPFIPFHLTPNSNQADWNENFRKKLPASNKRIIFTTDTINHDLFKYIKPSVCAVTLQRRDLKCDTWAIMGTEFPPSHEKLPVICVGQTIEQVYEEFLRVLLKLEEFALESEYSFNDNLHWNAYNAIYYLMREREKSGTDQKLLAAEFEIPHKNLSKVLYPYLKDKIVIKEDSEKKENKDVKQDNTRIGADTLMLISQEIPSIAAYAKDPNLKNPTIATKHPKKKGLETKKAEERAAALIRILETNEKKSEIPWTRLF